jgi:hypothetical protein
MRLYFNNIVISGHICVVGCGNMDVFFEMPVLLRLHDQPAGHLDTKTAMCLNFVQFVRHFSYEILFRWCGLEFLGSNWVGENVRA